MDLAQRDRLSELVEEMTTSGQPQLHDVKMKELKNICKVSPDCVEHVYHSVLSQLNQEHAEIRLSAFQIASELFSRSHHFRTVLLDNFQEFLELTVETDSEQPLPPPKAVAKKLKSLAIQTIQSWHASYGSAYKKLGLGYHFLKQVKNVDFQDVEVRTVSERRRQQNRQEKMERIYRERAEQAARDMQESCEDIQATLTEMDSCLKLLLPDDFSEIQTTNSSSRPTNECASEDDRPCCSTSTDLREERGSREGEVEEEEEDGKSEGGEAVNLFIRNSGLMSHSYHLDINLQPSDLSVKETEDNEAVVSTVIDLNRLITTKHLPAVQSWIQVFTRAGSEQHQLRRALDLKKSLEAALQKHRELHIHYKTSRVRTVMKASADGEEDEDEDDFQEVPEKEGFEPHIPEALRAEYGLDPSPSTSTAPTNKIPPPKRPALPPRQSGSTSSARRLKRRIEEEQDPTCAAATWRLLRQRPPLPTASRTSSPQQPTTAPSPAVGSAPSPAVGCGPSTSATDQKDVDVPVVPFGLDLFYWGKDQPSGGKIIKSAAAHQFWVPCEAEGEEVENEEMSAASRSRYISFPGTFTPVSHHCRAPLANGKLCPRQDRLKCPFHGRIIPRDEEGRPVRPEDRLREEQEERKRREEQPDWRDAELMREIEAATGEDLGSDRLQRGKGKGKKKKYPNLSDVKQNANTSRSRLQRKVFNKSSMRRVAEVMDKADKRKHEKFSNQFNYAMN